MKKWVVASACALLACASYAQKPLPNEAPKGKRWMSCYINFIPSQTIVAGYWLVSVPEDKRTETEQEMQKKFLEEYMPHVAAERPGIGRFDRANCTSYKNRSEWEAYSQTVKDPRHYRTDFKPSFATAFVSSKEHIRK